jgi:hypothetical protein
VSAPPLPTGDWTGREIASLLAPTLGWEKSEELVGAAARHLGLPGSGFDRYETAQILELLSQQPGIVGVAARFAHMNIDARRRAAARAIQPAPPRDERRPATDGAPVVPGPPSSRVVARRIPLSELVTLLAPTVGQEKSEETIATAARLKRITDESVTREQALAIFELLTETPGIIGVSARFAKVRMMLRFQGG